MKNQTTSPKTADLSPLDDAMAILSALIEANPVLDEGGRYALLAAIDEKLSQAHVNYISQPAGDRINEKNAPAPTPTISYLDALIDRLIKVSAFNEAATDETASPEQFATTDFELDTLMPLITTVQAETFQQAAIQCLVAATHARSLGIEDNYMQLVAIDKDLPDRLRSIARATNSIAKVFSSQGYIPQGLGGAYRIDQNGFVTDIA